MKCIVFAYSQLGYDCLQYILNRKDHSVCLVVTHIDNPNETIWFDSVIELAKNYNVDVITPENLKDEDTRNTILSYNAEVFFSFYYRHMIPQVLLDAPALGAYNMHGSLLPKYRGRCPVNWAIIHGEIETGVTLHKMEKSADTGDIVGQLSIKIGPDDTAGFVMEKLNALAVELLSNTIDLIAQKTQKFIPQDHQQTSYFGGRSAKDGEINWSQHAIHTHNLIRALSPQPQYPPAFGLLNNKVVKIKKSTLPNTSVLHNQINVSYQPGTIIEHKDDNSLIIACGPKGEESIQVWVYETIES